MSQGLTQSLGDVGITPNPRRIQDRHRQPQLPGRGDSDSNTAVISHQKEQKSWMCWFQDLSANPGI